MAQIRMTPDELDNGAATLSSIRGEIDGAVRNLDSTLNNVAGNWEGMAQDAFMQRYLELLPILKDTVPQVIEALEQKLKAAANAIRETDAQIANAFRG